MTKKLFENVESCDKYRSGDIRNFGVRGKQTDDASKTTNRKRLKERIELLRYKRKGDSLLPDVTERLAASSLLDSLNDNHPMGVGSVKKSDPRKKQKSNGLSIVGADVCKLFPR